MFCFSVYQEAIGSPAEEIAGWIVAGKSTLQRSIASAVLAAAACGQELPADDDADKLFGMDLKQEDTVGMIGLIRPVAKAISPKVKKIIAFDKGMSLHSKDPLLQPMEKQPELLPACDVVLLSGTTTINGTIDSLLAHCSGAGNCHGRPFHTHVSCGLAGKRPYCPCRFLLAAGQEEGNL